MSGSIHATAIVAPDAVLGEDVEIGPYCIVGPRVTLGPGTVLDAHVVVGGRTTVGRGNRFFPFCAIGGAPQDKKYKGEPCELIIGDRNTIREFSTYHIGTVQGGGVTRLGNDNWMMAYTHLAHDCVVGSHTIFANNAQIAGHVVVDDWVILGAYTCVHQFVRIGAHGMTGMGSVLLADQPPFASLRRAARPGRACRIRPRRAWCLPARSTARRRFAPPADAAPARCAGVRPVPLAAG